MTVSALHAYGRPARALWIGGPNGFPHEPEPSRSGQRPLCDLLRLPSTRSSPPSTRKNTRVRLGVERIVTNGRKFGKHASPSFAGGWEAKARALGKGLTVVRSDQCPYIVDATNAAVAAAAKAGIASRVIELESRDDLIRLSPSPYGVFGLVLDGKLSSYHDQLEKDLLPLLSAAKSSKAKS